jgi:hypothetical protein
MPKVRRQNVPTALLQHLLDRIQQRNISADQLGLLADWLDAQPEVTAGKWFKKLPGMTVCGEGELVKTFLLPGQAAEGTEIR